MKYTLSLGGIGAILLTFAAEEYLIERTEYDF